ncbi:transcriptional regulator [Herbaspirillum rubrisubalbicans]|uniref:Transcriptional regulator n=1 Tax=Herbaspirillum rubrisubalbicans TaxID=80842 RepID=A0AAD0U7J9_9BURK|nr:transcriptional regulator [Herbaspirillum rubrisubalbicans]AYR24554.1 transcriptional regulator [Herbaspirillum rubrisubalbicans]
MNTTEFLDRAKQKLGVESDYALAKALNMRASTISGYRAGRSRMDDDAAYKVAQILEIDPILPIAAANAERTKSPEMRAFWEGLAKKVAKSFDFLMPRPTPRPA